MSIHVLPIPTPFLVGRVNCYLVEDDPLTLVDTGPNSGTALVELEAALAAHGRKVEDLERIVLTHQHIDHVGLAQILADRSGAEICALDLLGPWLANYGQQMQADDEDAGELMAAHGIPQDLRHALQTISSQFRAWGAAATVDRELPDGGELAFAGRTWHVSHRPGHSPSDTVFHDAATGTLVGGDHLLAKISSVPLISRALDGTPGRPRALVTYLASLELTAALDLEVVLPGHGDAVTDHRSLIADRRRMTERRAAKIGALIAERPRTAFEIAQALWGNVAVTQAFLTLSEVLGHADLLVDRGEVVEEPPDDVGVVRFRAS